METVKEKLWRRRQPKALMHHTRDGLSNQDTAKIV